MASVGMRGEECRSCSSEARRLASYSEQIMAEGTALAKSPSRLESYNESHIFF